jgi:hypothetical protein
MRESTGRRSSSWLGNCIWRTIYLQPTEGLAPQNAGAERDKGIPRPIGRGAPAKIATRCLVRAEYEASWIPKDVGTPRLCLLWVGKVCKLRARPWRSVWRQPREDPVMMLKATDSWNCPTKAVPEFWL